jgi:hypothetical protein
MLGIDPDVVCAVIEDARRFQAKEDVVFPDSGEASADDWALQVLADHASDPVVAELRAEIDALTPEAQAHLVALMWLGRGDFTREEWPAAVASARANRTVPTADYLLSTPLAADYLADGLNQFGHSCDEG